jgi:Domain of unknown function (DUF4157)
MAEPAPQFAIAQQAVAADPARAPFVRPLSMPTLTPGAMKLRVPAMGNQAMQRALKSRVLQAKLTVNQPGDIYEQEADRVADTVMRMPEPHAASPAVFGAVPGVQRKCSCGGSCDKCKADESGEEHGRVQMKPAGAGVSGHAPAPSIAPPMVHEVLRSHGQPLDLVTRSFMEPRFGTDFAHVRVHTGPDAAESAREIGARAYTVGGHIVFGEGEYAPASDVGRGLLTHELAHVVQQNGGRTDGIVQRREVDDRSCAGLTDIKSDVNAEVNNEIGAARADVAAHSPPGSPIDVNALAEKVHKLLGDGAISPIEKVVEALPASKRNSPAADLAGTKYAGTFLSHFGHLAVASSANVNGVCIGADKLGHFFDVGFIYWQLSGLRATTPQIESIGRGLEMTKQGLGISGVFSNADLEANRKGFQFYKDLEANPSGLTFAIENYITDQWNEQKNPSLYASKFQGIAVFAAVVWSNLLTGLWRGTITHPGPSTVDIQFDLSATTSSVNGTYEWPAGDAHPNKGKITGGTITEVTTTVSGLTIPPTGPPTPASASAVSGVKIQFDWERGTSNGKGEWNSVDEQTLDGTWGYGASRTDGGVLKLKKV